MPTNQVTQPTDTQDTADTSFAAPSAAQNDATPQAPAGAASSPLGAPAFSNPLGDETGAADTTTQAASESSPTSPTADDLLTLKQQALGQLTPLVNHLDQSPEEKFRTTMMMIQSTDNEGLLKDAFEAAKSIADDKARAQALLDVINEINYFTQKKSS